MYTVTSIANPIYYPLSWQDFVATLAISDNPNHTIVFTFKSSFYLGIWLVTFYPIVINVWTHICLKCIYIHYACVCDCEASLPPFPGWLNLLLRNISYIVVFKHFVDYSIFDVYFLLYIDEYKIIIYKWLPLTYVNFWWTFYSHLRENYYLCTIACISGGCKMEMS